MHVLLHVLLRGSLARTLKTQHIDVIFNFICFMENVFSRGAFWSHVTLMSIVRLLSCDRINVQTCLSYIMTNYINMLHYCYPTY